MGIFFTLFYQPTANVLFFGMSLLNSTHVLVGLIFLLIFVKLILLSPTIKNTKIQKKMKSISKEMKEIQKIKDKNQQANQMIAVYRREKINPFYSILLLIIQIPILLSIFFVTRDIAKGDFSYETLYSFVNEPSFLVTDFLFFDLTGNGGIILATLVALSQMLLLWYLAKTSRSTGTEKLVLKFMFYFLTLISFVVTIFFVSLIGVYWLLNNLISLLQEVLLLSKIRKA